MAGLFCHSPHRRLSRVSLLGVAYIADRRKEAALSWRSVSL